ncbi:SSU ribosomal protein S24E [Desulfurococcus mucosus DSM 2162]|uniref:Small ribosomal subunit protein eS24 n=2 Tax=Desulfurococcus mucosus TaxID=2275 RepID=E8R7G3_DESM0|nr:SSU ribosomal protein S24E [Desulfurococcus mucosus DSM 2162]
MGKPVVLGKYSGEIVEEKYNPLIKRLELKIRVGHPNEGTPSKGLLRLELAKIYGKGVNLVYIRNVKTEYGLGVSLVEAHVYDSEERVKLFEPEYIIKRNEESLQKVSQSQEAGA